MANAIDVTKFRRACDDYEYTEYVVVDRTFDRVKGQETVFGSNDLWKAVNEAEQRREMLYDYCIKNGHTEETATVHVNSLIYIERRFISVTQYVEF